MKKLFLILGLMSYGFAFACEQKDAGGNNAPTDQFFRIYCDYIKIAEIFNPLPKYIFSDVLKYRLRRPQPLNMRVVKNSNFKKVLLEPVTI